MEQYIIQFDVKLDNFAEKTATGFVSATSHSAAVKQIEQYFGERNIIAITVKAWDTSVLLVPSNFIKSIEKENFEMSVDYTAGFAFGWHVTSDERWTMIEAYHEKTGDYDIENYFIQINSYRDDAGYIFGNWVSRFPEPGYCRKFDPEMIEIPKDWFDEFIPMLRDAGRSDLALNVPASLWAIHSIW